METRFPRIRTQAEIDADAQARHRRERAKQARELALLGAVLFIFGWLLGWAIDLSGVYL